MVIKLRRYSQYYILNLIVPVFVMSTIGFFAVFLPPNTSDKINMTVTVLLGFMFLQSLISTLVPKSSSIPRVSHYLLWELLLSAFNIAANSFTYSLNGIRTIHKLPRCLSILFGILSIIVFYKINLNLNKIRGNNIPATTENYASNAGIKGIFNQRFFIKSDFFTENHKYLSGKDIAIMLNRLCSFFYLAGSLAILMIYLIPLIFG